MQILAGHPQYVFYTVIAAGGYCALVGFKTPQPKRFSCAVIAVMAGAVANRVLDMLTGASTPKEFYDGLTAREVEILKLMATGQANKQIAFNLKISEKTVRNHISHIYEKLQIYDRAQAVLYAVRKALVEL